MEILSSIRTVVWSLQSSYSDRCCNEIPCTVVVVVAIVENEGTFDDEFWKDQDFILPLFVAVIIVVNVYHSNRDI